jgi:transketolase
LRKPPYPIVVKPYGRALLELARERDDIVCLSGDLTRQCEIDLFENEIPERFINTGMAEANMIGVAGALARRGHIPFVHTFGVFATRRPLDQIINAVAYPNLPVRIVGFMPGVSSPGGPSHQAIDDVALMRAIPNMTVVDVADAVETAQAVRAIVDVPGPVYLRLKRGDIPEIFDDDHRFSLDRAQVLRESAHGADGAGGADVAIVANGMMVSAALAAADALEDGDVSVKVLNVPVVKPLDAATITAALRPVRAVVTAENHSVIGGLGTAVAEVLAEGGLGCTLRRIGLRDTFAEGARSAATLFRTYRLSTQDIIDDAWALLGRHGAPPQATALDADGGGYAPV